MWSSATSFVAGYAISSSCNALPCHAKLNLPNRTFKLSILVHSANLDEVKPGMVHNQRPYVAITFGDRTKETELADWSGEKSQWCFREIVTVETSLEDELSVSVSSLTSYNLYVASVGFSSSSIGEVCIPVADISQCLRVEDRDTDGIIYATKVLPLDLTRGGKTVGRIFLSFETTTQPSSVFRATSTDKCCGFGGIGISVKEVEEFDAFEPEPWCPNSRAGPGRRHHSGSRRQWTDIPRQSNSAATFLVDRCHLAQAPKTY